LEDINLICGWVAMLGGVISGAIVGLRFDREDFLGGYNAFRRRLIRLGHISFFGLGILNVLFSLTIKATGLPPDTVSTAAFILALATMPLVCFLTAFRGVFKHLFPVPVLAATVGIVSVSVKLLNFN
jgi:hypothetical protein